MTRLISIPRLTVIRLNGREVCMAETITRSNLSRVLGATLVLQAAASLISGALLLNPLIDADNIDNTMLSLANRAPLAMASIFGDILTALGIVCLAAILHAVTEKRNKAMANVALGFYILEAGILIASKAAVFVLLNISQDYMATGDRNLESMARLALETQAFLYRIHIIPFGFGAMIFYYLLYRSKALPAWLSLWGLATVPLVLVGAIATSSGIQVPPLMLALAVPYVPFEFFAGIFILVRGFRVNAQ